MTAVTISILTARGNDAVTVAPAGIFPLPADPTLPWVLPRDREHAALARRLAEMPTRLDDYGWAISTGPLVWNRHKPQLRARWTEGTVPIVWAEAVLPGGGFDLDYQKRADKRWLKPRPERDSALLVRERVGLVQRTTAKEQPRRLLAACLPQDLLDRYGAVTVENHVNMVRAQGRPTIALETVVALLNSAVVDEAFRCVSGSVAVSAFELEGGLPLPGPAAMAPIDRAVRAGHPPKEIEAMIAAEYRRTP